MAIPSEADLAELITDELKDVSSDFAAQDAAIHSTFEDGLATALARVIRQVLLTDMEATVDSGTMTGEDSAGDTPDTLAAPVAVA